MAATFEALCAAIDLISTPFSLLDLDGRIRHLNAANERLLGRTIEALRGQPIGVILPTELRDRADALLTSLVSHGTLHGVFLNVLPDGSTVPVEVSAEIVRSPDGEPRWILAGVRDISGQIEQLEQLSASALGLLNADDEDLLIAVVRGARRLLGARYAALGVVEADRLVRFIPDGLSGAEVAGIDHWPEGHGLLGAMMTERRTIRVADIGADPRRSGFPPGHPPMRSFLGTPIRTADELYGQLYFTDKLETLEFSVVDERIAEIFASHAAITIRDRRRRDELEVNRRSLADAQRIAHIGSWERSLRTGALTWSNEVYSIVGIERAAFDNTVGGLLAVVHPDDRAKALTDVTALEAGAEAVTEYRIIRPDGAVRVLREEAEIVRDEAGTPVRLIGTTQDVTERRELEAQQVRFARLLDELTSEIYVFDAATLRFTEANSGACRSLGYSIDELRERTPLDLKPEFTRASFETLLAPLLAGERAQVAFETIHRRKDGSTYPIEVRVHLLSGETPPVFVAIVQDITERVAAEKERTRLVAAVEQAADSIWIHDPDGTITYVNPSFSRLYGYAPEEVVGRYMGILDSGAHEPAFWAALFASVAAGQTWAGSVVNRCKDGSLVEVEKVISPVHDPAGRLTAVVQSDRDVTRERALESALARDARERQAIEAALELIDPEDSPEAIAAAACAEIAELPHVDSAWALGLGPAHGRVLAAAGRLSGVLTSGRPLPEARARYLLERAAGGPWIEEWRLRPEDGPYGEAITAAGLQTAAFAPLRGAHGVVGVVALGAHDPANADRVIERLPALATFGSIVGALLAPGLEARHREADARATIAAILDGAAFRPFFQPIVDLHSSAVVGYEALTRFADGSAPDVVFATAARAGLGIELERATMAAALAAAAVLPSEAYLSLNASPALIGSGELRSLLAGQTRPIVLEITEHVAIDDYPALRDALAALRPTVRLAVDDAGAGYASFRHILELAPDFVKLDIGLIAGIDADPARQALLAGMGYFAVKRSLRLIAEGVETATELETLRGLAISYGQGYLLGRPQDGRGPGPWPTTMSLTGG